jgi:diguanylate cyclase (GGDEF)-like protein
VAEDMTDSDPMDGTSNGGEPSPLELADVTFITDGLAHLVADLCLVAAVPAPGAPPKSTMARWVDPAVPSELHAIVAALVSPEDGERQFGTVASDDGKWRIWLEPVGQDPSGRLGTLVAARGGQADWRASETSLFRVFASMCEVAWASESAERQTRLDQLVVSVARVLMPTSTATYQTTMERVLAMLGEFLEADIAFVRRSDHAAGVSILVAEWPKRPEIPDPDPLGVFSFEDGDPLIAASKDFKEPLIIGKAAENPGYNEAMETGAGVDDFSGAAVPLINGEITEGLLGFLHFRTVHWTRPELNALEAVASMIVQVNARIEADANLNYIALHDDLTGLPNRRALIEEVERRLNSGNTQTALIFLDLDRFKYMNDYLGHLAGDRVLVTIADRIRLSVRPGDYTARLGGDEFVVVMSASGGELGAMATANRLLSLISKPLEVNAQHVSHTGSVGIAMANPGEMTALQLLGNADVALYAAKTQGRNRAVMFDDVLRLAVDERTNTEIFLRRAIESGGLRLHYQPEIDLVTGQLLGVEALLRCEHPERGIVSAGEFIAVAEETGLIVDLGRWVLEESCRQMRIWRDRYPGLDLLMRVNMSPAQLGSPGITEHIGRCLRMSNLLGSSLCLEITEHVVMQDIERATSILGEFRGLGVRLALDDFGTGFSSMAQLKRIPIDTLKIDMSFVIGLAKDPADQAIVESIIHLGEAFGLDLVAEGVENREDMDELLRLGCHRAQGFLLAKPMAPGDLDPILWRGAIDLSRV